MKTDELVDLLSRDAAAPAQLPGGMRLALAAVVGVAGALLLMAVLLGVNPGLSQALALPMFWVKFGSVAVVALLALPMCRRLGMPGRGAGAWPLAIAAIVVTLWVLALVSIRGNPPAQVSQQVFGQTWMLCPLLISLLALPALGAILIAMRGLAPTQARQAGAASGLLAAAIGATAYALHCPEFAPPFIAIWYLLGLAAPTVIGAAFGPRLLGW